MPFWSILLLALVMNIDGFTAGLAYRMAGMDLPLSSRLLMSGASAVILACSMLLGASIANFVPASALHYLPGVLLILMGLFLLWQAKIKKQEAGGLIWQVRVPFFGVMIQILRDPKHCDKNHDQTILGGEALYLGVALAMDSWGIGLALGVDETPVLLAVIMVAVIEFLLLTLSLRVGAYLCKKQRRWQGRRLRLLSSYLPALVLLGLGLVKILF